MAKRAHGEGSIYKRDNGAWRGQVTVGGRRLSYTARTRREVQEWLKKTTGQVERGLTYDQARVTLADYLSRWLASSESSLRPATFDHYTLLVENYIIPSLGAVPVKDLTPDHVQAAYDDLLQQGAGVPTVIKAHAVLHSALERAVKTGLAYRNAAGLATPPSPPKTERLFWDEREAAQFLLTAQPNRLYALFYLAIATGARQMELCGLRWGDLDWAKATLRIQRQLARSGPEMFVSQKTDAARRTIRLGGRTMEVLQDHLERQTQERFLAGDRWQEHDLIFTSGIGTPMHHKNLVDRYFKPLVKAAGVTEIRFHDLRHTAASIMLSHGKPVIVISKILGHARVSITLDTYGHLIPGADAGVGEMMDELLSQDDLAVADLRLE